MCSERKQTTWFDRCDERTRNVTTDLIQATGTGEDATRRTQDLVDHAQGMGMIAETTVHSTAIATIVDLAQEGQRCREIAVEGAMLNRGHSTGTEEGTAGD